MDVKYLETSIGSYEFRLENRKADAMAATARGYFLSAQDALNDCIRFEAVIRELKHQQECMEVNNA